MLANEHFHSHAINYMLTLPIGIPRGRLCRFVEFLPVCCGNESIVSLSP